MNQYEALSALYERRCGRYKTLCNTGTDSNSRVVYYKADDGTLRFFYGPAKKEYATLTPKNVLTVQYDMPGVIYMRVGVRRIIHAGQGRKVQTYIVSDAPRSRTVRESLRVYDSGGSRSICAPYGKGLSINLDNHSVLAEPEQKMIVVDTAKYKSTGAKAYIAKCRQYLNVLRRVSPESFQPEKMKRGYGGFDQIPIKIPADLQDEEAMAALLIGAAKEVAGRSYRFSWQGGGYVFDDINVVNQTLRLVRRKLQEELGCFRTERLW